MNFTQIGVHFFKVRIVYRIKVKDNFLDNEDYPSLSFFVII